MFEAADFDGGIELLCPDAEWDVRDFLDGEVYKGRAAIRAFWEYLYDDVWETVKMVEERLVDAGTPSWRWWDSRAPAAPAARLSTSQSRGPSSSGAGASPG